MAKTRKKNSKTPVKGRKSNTMMTKSPVITRRRVKGQTQKSLTKNVKTMLYESPLKHLRHNGEQSNTQSQLEDTKVNELEQVPEHNVETAIVHNSEEGVPSCSKSGTKTKREEDGLNTLEESVPMKKRKLNKSPLSRFCENEKPAASKILDIIDESVICVDDLETDPANYHRPNLQSLQVNSDDIVVLDDTLPLPPTDTSLATVPTDTRLAQNLMDSIIVLDDEPQTSGNQTLTRPTEDLEVLWASGPTIPTTLSSSRQNRNLDILKCDKILLDTGGEPSNLRYLKNDSNKRLVKKSPRITKIGVKNFTTKKVANITKSLAKTNIATKVVPKANKTPAKKKGKGELIFQQTETKQKSASDKPKKGTLREIVIDGSNVAMAYTKNKVFSEKGIKMLIDYFSKKGHTVKVFVPQHKRSRNHVMLERWYEQGIVVFTPSRKLGSKIITSYDDRYILEYATACKGVVVSQDQFRDLYAEKVEYRDTIENRLLIPTFVGDYVMFPEDPLGRNGPSLAQFLKH